MAKLKELWYSLPLKVRDVLARAGKTFVQTFIAGVPIATLVGADLAVVKATVLAAFAAAVSASWNVIFPPSSGEVKLVPFPVPVAPDDLLPPKEA